MDYKVKVKVYRHTKKFLIAKFGDGPLSLKPGSVVHDYIKVCFTGKHYTKVYANHEKYDIVTVVLSEEQFAKYKSSSHDHIICTALEDFFKISLYEHVKTRVDVGIRMHTGFRDFLEKYDLHGEDINIDFLRKKYYRHHKNMTKTYSWFVPKCVPKIVPKIVPNK